MVLPGGIGIYDIIPCNRMTVLDCFQDGGFDFIDQSLLDLLYLILGGSDPELRDLMKEFYGIIGYGHLPKIEDLTDDEIKSTISGGCIGWVTKLDVFEWPTPAIVGGVDPAELASGVNITHGSALLTQFRLAKSKDLAKRAKIGEMEAAEICR